MRRFHHGGAETRRLAALVICLAWLSECGVAQARPNHKQVSFVGQVSAGQDFQTEISNSLIFMLRAERQQVNPQGWRIEIQPKISKLEPPPDYARIATPPYRSSNPLYLNLSYGITARDAVRWTPRDFGFVTSEAEHEALSALVRKLLWKPPEDEGKNEKELDALDAKRHKEWQDMLSRVAEGKVHILKYRLRKTESGEEIEWLRFKVELFVPCSISHAPNLRVDASRCRVPKKSGK